MRSTRVFCVCSLITTSLVLIGAPAARTWAQQAITFDTGMNDDPTLMKVDVDRLEWRDAEAGPVIAWDVDAWLGGDTHKLWFVSEGEKDLDGAAGAIAGLRYSRAIAPFWDLQLGYLHEFSEFDDREWASLGLKGLAPYWFEIDAQLWFGPHGRLIATSEIEYEILVTRRWILTPRLAVQIRSRDEPARLEGAGFSHLEVGLRLRYEPRRHIAPYIGLHYQSRLGETRDRHRRAGAATTDFQALVGLRMWF